MTVSVFDFIIVGGGSAGCLLASQLVQAKGAQVLLLEAGPARGSWLLDLPAGYMKFLNREDYLTLYKSTPQGQLDGRSVIIPQGALLGGGSAVNAMVYMRGQAKDYDDWDRDLGGAGWSYSDLLPHFTAVEDNDTFGPPFHGKDGPLKVSHLGYHCSVSADFVAACEAMGIAPNPDFNGERQAGVGYMQHTISEAQRKRSSAARAFLAPLKDDPRLQVKTRASVTDLILEEGRAVGVRYHQAGSDHAVRTNGEIILSAGSFATPTILMRSGIGPADDLQKCGIQVKHDVPGVGKNLHDHCEVPLVATTKSGLGYYRQDKGLRMLRNGLQYVLTRTGRVTTTGVEACAFLSSSDQGRPDLQIYCVPTVYLDRTVTGAKPTYGVTLSGCLIRPKSRGSLRLNQLNPDGRPQIDPGFLREPEDRSLAERAIEIMREIIRSEPLSDIVVKEIMPLKNQTDPAQIRNHCLSTVKTNYHPVGTCKMGIDRDNEAVVDPQLQVRGIAGLRIVDASIIPSIPSGNTNAPAMAIAHRAADFIAG